MLKRTVCALLAVLLLLCGLLTAGAELTMTEVELLDDEETEESTELTPR